MTMKTLIMNILYIAIYILIDVISSSSFAASSPIIQQQDIFNQTNLKSPWGTEYFCFRVPSVVQSLKTGTILAFVESRISSCHDQAPKDITMRRSTDNGKTWSILNLIVGPKKHKINQLDFSSRNPYAVIDEGTIILQWVDSTNSSHCINYMQKSMDDGLTWSKAEIVELGNTFEGTLLGPGNGIVLGRHSASVGAGRIIICGASGYVGGMKMYASIWYSDDHGKTFQMSRGAAPFYHMEECQIAELDNGTVIINMRNHLQKYRAISISLDDGETFLPHWYDYELPDPTCSAGLINMNGTLYFSNNPTTSKRMNMTLKKSINGGETWEKIVQLYNGPSGYSVVTPVSTNEVGVVYEKDGSKSIVFATVRVG